MRARRNRFYWWYALYLPPLALALSMMLTGCATSGNGASAPMPELAGTRWTVTRIDGRAPVSGDAVTADFGVDGRINGNSSCNNFSGPYIQDGGELQVGELLSTRRACAEPDRQRQENRVLVLLQGANRARLSHDELTIAGPPGSLVLVPAGFAASNSAPRRVQYDCEGTGLTVLFERDSAEITWSDGRDTLMQRPAASGIWYESAANSLRGKQDLTWTQRGRTPRSCRELR